MEMPLKYGNLKYQLEFLNTSNIHILASNQDHLIGNNSLKSCKSFPFLIKNLNTFVAPFKGIIRWGFSVFNIFLGLIKVFIGK